MCQAERLDPSLTSARHALEALNTKSGVESGQGLDSVCRDAAPYLQTMSPYSTPAAFNPQHVESIDQTLRAGVTRVFRRYAAEPWQWREHEDVVAEAWLVFLKTRKDGTFDGIEGSVRESGGDDRRVRKVQWVFVTRCAEYEAFNFLRSCWRLRQHDWPQTEDGEDLDVPDSSPSTGRFLRPELAKALEQAFLAQRSKRGARGEKAAARDVRILDMRIRGYSFDGIAVELGCTPASAESWQRDVRARLRRIVTQGGLDLPDFPAAAAGNACARCAAPAHSWHHVVPRRAGGEDYETVPLCLECHSEVENWYMRQECPDMTPEDWRTVYAEWLTL